jgi:hypothetical protein
MEIWKDVKGYEGCYEVSTLGNVKGVKRGRLRVPVISNYGYLRLNLSINNIKKIHSIHQLVAVAFLNHTPNGNTLVVDHINNIKTDNRLSNLQIITNRQNVSKDMKNKTSIYTGVSIYKKTNRWKAQIVVNRVKKHLGYFTNEIDASNAYQKALCKSLL